MQNKNIDIAQLPTNVNPLIGAKFPMQAVNNGIMDAYFYMELSQNDQPLFSLFRHTSFSLNEIQNLNINPIFYLFNDTYNVRKEEFYITGIKNLRKNIKFLQLAKDLASKTITEDEFETEIGNNHNKYLIDINPMLNTEDAILLHDVVNKIGEDLSIDEAGDIFSFDANSIKEHFNKLIGKNG